MIGKRYIIVYKILYNKKLLARFSTRRIKNEIIDKNNITK